MHIPFSTLAGEVLVLISALSAIGGVVYWVLKKNLEDVFMKKSECSKTHTDANQEMKDYRAELKEDLNEIKKMIMDIQTKFYEYITRR